MNTYLLFAIIIGIFVRFIVGMVWYSPLFFKKAWLKEEGKDPEFKPEGSSQSMAISFVFSVISTFILWMNIVDPQSGYSDPITAVLIASMLWLGFSLPRGVNFHVFSLEKKSWKLFLIHEGQELVSLLLSALAISLIYYL